MKKIECLAPAGTMEALRAAVMAGADAIYCGGTQFGARAFAGNFNHEEIIEAVQYCHLRGVKLYVTMNTLLFEDEFNDALKEVDFYVKHHIDALIVQDLGLFTVIRHRYPDFEIHCSTQMHVHNASGVRVMKRLGASRVVLARETPYHIIEECCKQGLEIEVFSYGALCVSYSGQCLMSSLLQNRSGNRGACAQYCRMQYDLVNKDTGQSIKTDGKYLLSPKDLKLIDEIPQLIEAGVTSLKIEGRMKRPEYVYLVVKTFREAIDAYYDGKKMVCSDDLNNQLKLLFNRQFTVGHCLQASGKSIINTYRPNHQGIRLGKVIQATNEGFSVKLETPLQQHDGLRILSNNEDFGFIANKIYFNGKLVNHANVNDVVTFEDHRFIPVGSIVVKTTDVKLMGALSKFEAVRKVLIDIEVGARPNQVMWCKITDGEHEVYGETSMLCQTPVKSPIEKQRVFEQLLKLNDTVYECQNITGDITPFFLPLKEINELRRQVIEKLNQKRLLRKAIVCNDQELPRCLQTESTFHGFVEVNTHEQAKALHSSNILVTTPNIELLNEFNYLVPMTPVVNEKGIYNDDRGAVVTELGALDLNNKVIATHHFNVTNSYALNFLYNEGIKLVELSQECSDEQAIAISEAFKIREGYTASITQFGYGRRDLMTSKTCVVNNCLSDGNKKNCKLCKVQQYVLKDIKDTEFPIMGDSYCISHILEEKPFHHSNYQRERYVTRFTTESTAIVNQIWQ